MKNNLVGFFKGTLIGATMLVPGVSGGSMAMILGIYNKLISSVSSFFKDVKKNLIFLIMFVAGAGIGMYIAAKPLLILIESYEKPAMFFFIGVVAGGIPLIYKSAEIKKIKIKHIIYILLGFAFVIGLMTIPETTFTDAGSAEDMNYIIRIAVGIIAAVALVLPGISVSYLLLLIGVYDKTIEAVGNMDIMYLLPMAIGLGLGIILITKLLDMAMNKYPQITYLTILGFIIGSVITVFPGFPENYQWITCGVLAVFGYLLIGSISKFPVK